MPDDRESADFELAADDDADTRPVDLGVVRKLLPFVQPHRVLLAGAIVLVLARTAVGISGPRLQGSVLGSVTRGDVDTATFFALVLLAVQTVMVGFSWAQGYTLTKLGQRGFSSRHNTSRWG
jgi:ABC-type multidrug transport system fused ATPase/permease subunit